MKGFIRILEAIISSLILIAVLPFFLVQPSESEWGNIALQTNALDTLEHLSLQPNQPARHSYQVLQQSVTAPVERQLSLVG